MLDPLDKRALDAVFFLMSADQNMPARAGARETKTHRSAIRGSFVSIYMAIPPLCNPPLGGYFDG